MNKRSILIFLWSLTTVSWASKTSALPTVNNLDGQHGSVAKVNVKVQTSKFNVQSYRDNTLPTPLPLGKG